jgi:hypothetical protein
MMMRTGIGSGSLAPRQRQYRVSTLQNACNDLVQSVLLL